jgi:hypothetical protein
VRTCYRSPKSSYWYCTNRRNPTGFATPTVKSALLEPRRETSRRSAPGEAA